jgi:hypothetical protein
MAMENEVKEAMLQAILGTKAAQSISVANAGEIIVAIYDALEDGGFLSKSSKPKRSRKSN